MLIEVDEFQVFLEHGSMILSLGDGSANTILQWDNTCCTDVVAKEFK